MTKGEWFWVGIGIGSLVWPVADIATKILAGRWLLHPG